MAEVTIARSHRISRTKSDHGRPVSQNVAVRKVLMVLVATATGVAVGAVGADTGMPPDGPSVERVEGRIELNTGDGSLRGSGGIRIEGAFEGDITIRGLVVVGETGRINCENITANTVVVAGVVHGNISTERLEIRSTGRVWGDVVTVAFSTEDGSFLRGQVRMEEEIDLGLAPLLGPTITVEETLSDEDRS